MPKPKKKYMELVKVFLKLNKKLELLMKKMKPKLKYKI